jgi:hypothetical protein
MKTYLKLPAIIGVLGVSALVASPTVAPLKPPAEKAQAGQSSDDSGRGTPSDGPHAKDGK